MLWLFIIYLDLSGIPAKERMQKLHAMSEYLQEGIDWGSFPTPGSYVKGIPIVQVI